MRKRDFEASLVCALLFSTAAGLLEAVLFLRLTLSVSLFYWMLAGAMVLVDADWCREYPRSPFARWLMRDGVALVLWPLIYRQIQTRGNRPRH